MLALEPQSLLPLETKHIVTAVSPSPEWDPPGACAFYSESKSRKGTSDWWSLGQPAPNLAAK